MEEYESIGDGHYRESFGERLIIAALSCAGCLLIFGPMIGALVLAGTTASEPPQSAPVEREQAPPAPRQAA